MPARIFISYRRDDSAGYAGRLEASLESRFGAGCVFRDASDIAPGSDFAAVIGARLAEAQAVLVLIGPRWAGAGDAARRRIDEPGDFVRIEVQAALASGRLVVPVLLQGVSMPAAASLPAPLQPLAERQALALGDTHWEADVDRLVAALGLRGAWPWRRRLLGAGAALIGAAGAIAYWRGLDTAHPGAAPDGQQGSDRGSGRDADRDAQLLGSWQAELRYDWGDRYTERFVFERHDGMWVARASFLGALRTAEDLRWDGQRLQFQTRSRWSVSGGAQGEQTLAYLATLEQDGGAPLLRFRLQISGSYQPQPALDFVARRLRPVRP